MLLFVAMVFFLLQACHLLSDADLFKRVKASANVFRVRFLSIVTLRCLSVSFGPHRTKIRRNEVLFFNLSHSFHLITKLLRF